VLRCFRIVDALAILQRLVAFFNDHGTLRSADAGVLPLPVGITDQFSQ
jgi:hypothetical protein